MLPVLYTTYNRLKYTKKTLPPLLEKEDVDLFVIDNASTDGTKKYLKGLGLEKLCLNKTNRGVGGAMNQFLELVEGEKVIGKIDNDTLVPATWPSSCLKVFKSFDLDALQPKHPIIHYSYDTFEEWMKELPKVESNGMRVWISPFVGGSGLILKTESVIERLGEAPEGLLMGWGKYQSLHPELKTAFTDICEIKLLDTKKDNIHKKEYEEYRAKTGRGSRYARSQPT